MVSPALPPPRGEAEVSSRLGGPVEPPPPPVVVPARLSTMEFTRRTAIAVGLATLAVVGMLLVWAGAGLLALFFLGVLIGVLLRGLASFVHRHTKMNQAWALALVLILIAAGTAGAVQLLAPAVIQQVGQLTEQIPRSLAAIEERIAGYPAGEWLLEAIPDLETLIPRAGMVFEYLPGLLSGALGMLVSVLVVLFIGLYMAADPKLYARGIVALVAVPHRRRAWRLIREVYATLKRWLLGKALTMAAVGVLTGVGLWLVGMDLVITLAIFTALMEFIPNFGPYIGAAPALLVAMLHGPEMVLWVLGVYIVVQTIEGYILTPLVQQRMVHIPPALLIIMQIVLWVLVGVIGLLVAAPATAAALVIVRELYVRGTLGDEKGARQGAPLPNPDRQESG